MKHRSCCLLLLCFLGPLACSPSAAVINPEDTLVLEVAPDSVSCVGEMRGSCIQVRSPGEEAWKNFYDPITGFQHEPGVRYVLEVGRTEVPNPPADGSAYAFRLIRIISREPGGDP